MYIYYNKIPDAVGNNHNFSARVIRGYIAKFERWANHPSRKKEKKRRKTKATIDNAESSKETLKPLSSSNGRQCKISFLISAP